MESEMFIVQKMLILCINLKTVTGILCFYYPNASNYAFNYGTECKFACCDGYAKTINTTCCDIDDYNVIIPVSIIFGTIGLCCLCACMSCIGYMIYRCCDKSTVNPITPNRPATVHPISPHRPNLDRLPELPSRSLAPRSLNLPTYDELNNITIRTDAPPRYETFINRQL